MAAQALQDDDTATAQRKSKAATTPPTSVATQPAADASAPRAPTIAIATAPPSSPPGTPSTSPSPSVPTLTRTLSPRPNDSPSTPTANSSAAGMGAMVNGVRTFSDGTGSVARTLSTSQMSQLGASYLAGTPDAQRAPVAGSTPGSAGTSPVGAGSASGAAGAPTGAGATINGTRVFSDGSGSIPRTLSSSYYDNPNSPGYNSGFAQISRALTRAQQDDAVRANPVGPPSLLTPPGPNNELRAGVRVNPTVTDLSNEGALRPASGNFSAANPQPLVDAGGHTMQGMTDTAGVTRTPPVSPAAGASVGDSTGSAQTNGGVSSFGHTPGIARSLSDPAPLLASVTPSTAANANELRGITRGLSEASQPVRSDSGRLLGYGQMVNGVRVFSDGSGGPTAPPRTMSDADIANLGREGRLTRADSGIGGNIDSVAYRGGASLGGGAANRVLAGTPELGSDAGLALSRQPAATAQGGGVFHMPSKAEQLQSDMTSALNRDTRSPIGLAMRNMDVDAKSVLGRGVSNRGGRRGGGGGGGAAVGAELAQRNDDTRKMYLGMMDHAMTGENSLNQEGLRQAGDTQRAQLDAASRIAATSMNNQTEMQRAFANRPAPTQVPLGDGTLGLLGQDGVVRRATDAQGNPIRSRAQPTAEETKVLNERTNLLLGVNPDTGLKQDGTPPTAAELHAADQAARAGFGAESPPRARQQQQGGDANAAAAAEQQAQQMAQYAPPPRIAARPEYVKGQIYVDAGGNVARWNGSGWEPF